MTTQFCDLDRSGEAPPLEVPNVSVVSIAVFVEVANCLSLREAAQRLFMEPSTVSKMVTRLENELGRKLFIRTTRKVSLTPDGEAALAAAVRVLEGVRALVEAEPT